MGLVSGKGGGVLRLPECVAPIVREQEGHLSEEARDAVVSALNERVLKPEVLAVVYERTAKKIKEHFRHVPEELRLKKVELNRVETRVQNSIEFIASGRATPGLADALAEAED